MRVSYFSKAQKSKKFVNVVDLLALEIKLLVLIRNPWLSPVLLIEFPIKVIYI